MIPTGWRAFRFAELADYKAGRTPEQAGMGLARAPRAPHRYMQITFYSPIPDKRWRPYLFLD